MCRMLLHPTLTNIIDLAKYLGLNPVSQEKVVRGCVTAKQLYYLLKTATEPL